MERTVLHVDCNKFYASVECLHRPELRDKPVAVGGSTESRHGIILTKNEIASRYGLVAGEPLWQARQKCPQLVVVPPNFPLYMRFSKMARRIYEDYSDYIEPFGLDENWLDVTGDDRTGEQIAQEIRRRVKAELGITVSVGVSFNKIFAKLGSDYKKPDAVTVISRENYHRVVWPLPCSDLLCVGPATTRKLNAYGVYTIGELAAARSDFLQGLLGKNGLMLRAFARGEDTSPVQHMDAKAAVKSVGNSTTTPRDLVDDTDVKVVFTVLAESVARRMREQGLQGRTVCISLRDKNLQTFTRRHKLAAATDVSTEILQAAALLHDMTKELSPQEQIALCDRYGIPRTRGDVLAPKCFHAMTAAALIPVMYPAFADPRIVSAVRWHTTGRVGMTLDEKLIYLADYIDESRTFPDCVTLRNLFWDAHPEQMEMPARLAHLRTVLIVSYDMTITGLIRDGVPVSPDTFLARNELLCEQNGL